MIIKPISITRPIETASKKLALQKDKAFNKYLSSKKATDEENILREYAAEIAEIGGRNALNRLSEISVELSKF